MKKISVAEILTSLGVKSIAEIDQIPKDHRLVSSYHVAGSSAYLAASKSIGQLISRLPLNSSSVAYRKGLSYFDFFRPHLKGKYFLRLDIKSFFHSITIDSIIRTFDSHIKGSKRREKSELTRKLTDFLTIEFEGKKILPIGFPASPQVANLVFRSLDIQIEKLCLEKGVSYTRYADDLLFSSQSEKVIHSTWFESTISSIISQQELKLNNSKKIKTKGKISLNGYLISGSDYKKISFSNKRLTVVRKLLYFKNKKNYDDLSIMRRLFPTDLKNLHLVHPNKNEFLKVFAQSQILQKLKGFRSYLLSIVNYGEKYNCIEQSHRIVLLELISNLNDVILKYEN
ncbi:reverse transcriptase family protein [Shewanella algae]|uniref:reverse transcriptase family protein n=1 Tax=Shewanella algae TaxID=38313 RepID=UPI000C34B1D4|nr:reverse transcriptase family protein [Shewanella algae]MBO2642848.1 RNA-directed DNA polymerase [Shewanella algae]